MGKYIKDKKEKYVEIIAIIDRSGSMASCVEDSIGGFNTFLKNQQKIKGKANFTTVLFDHEYLVPVNNVDIQDVKKLTTETYEPRGGTALLDAIGKTINNTNARLNEMKKSDRPSKIIVCILTDGYENQSVEFNSDQIKTMIEAHQKKDWQFIYLGADQDAFAVAGGLGIMRANTANYNSRTTKVGYATMDSMTTSGRLGGQSDVSN